MKCLSEKNALAYIKNNIPFDYLTASFCAAELVEIALKSLLLFTST